MYQKIYCRDADLEVDDLRNAAPQSATSSAPSGPGGQLVQLVDVVGASSVTVTGENVEYLTAMGFSEGHARFSLQQTGCFYLSLSFYVIACIS